MEDYKGYFISSLAVPTYLTGRKSKSLGIVLKSGRSGSVIEVKRIDGACFDGNPGRQSAIRAFSVSLMKWAVGHLQQGRPRRILQGSLIWRQQMNAESIITSVLTCGITGAITDISVCYSPSNS
jgi:hypothetical protein